ncbi:MAG: ADOP family duplicated permease [Vicinamibacteria bacterium]|nr:ADOP family duplicated permease [Vicinamibacteria bacterium]
MSAPLWARLLVRGCGSEFRRRHGAELLDTVTQQRKEPRYHGAAGALSFVAEAGGDLLALAARQRLAGATAAARAGLDAFAAGLRDPRAAVEGLVHDTWLATRALRRRKVYALAVTVTLALGLGAHLTIFSVAHALLGTPLPGADGDRLVAVSLISAASQGPSALSLPDVRDLATAAPFESVVAATPDGLPLKVAGRESRVAFVLAVTANYFDALRVRLQAGRAFGAADDGHDAIVLSDAAWGRHFHRDPAAVGAVVRLAGRDFTVVGVADPRFEGTAGPVDLDGFVSVAAYARAVPAAREWMADRDARALRTIARLRPGVGLEQAELALAPLSAQMDAQRGEAARGQRLVLHPEPMARLEPSAPVFLPPIAAVFLALVGLLVLVAVANVAGLALARVLDRRRELAVRLALGAGRLRLLRPLVLECLLLGLAGGLAGLALAWGATSWLGELRIASDLPIVFRLRPDARVFAVGLALSAAAGLAAGVLPGLAVLRTGAAGALRERGGSGARGRARSALVVAQVAVSAALLVAGALLLQSLEHFRGMDLGFARAHRALAGVDVRLRELDPVRGEAFFTAWLERTRRLPGVTDASFAAFLPIGLNNDNRVARAEGEQTGPGKVAWSNAVGERYFAAMGIPLRHGRDFAPTDDGEAPRVTVVNESLARELWPGQEALGRKLLLEGEAQAYEVIGVAADSTYNLPGEAQKWCAYLSLRQSYRSDRRLIAVTSGPPEALLPELRRLAAELDPEMPVSDLRTMEAHLAGGKAAFLFRLAGALTGSFGAIGFALAAIGLYGALAYAVGQRVPELAVRLALGATGGQLSAGVVREGLVLSGLGLLIGLPLAFGLARALENLLVGVSATDGATYGLVALTLAAGGALAAWLPALKASRVDPAISLRAD